MSNPRFNPSLKLAANPTFARFIAGEQIVPTNVEISPCHVCNATCEWCFYRGTHGKMNPAHLFEPTALFRLISQCAEMGVKAITWTGGGEPTLHPHFPAACAVAHRDGLKQGLFTNALLLPKYDPSLFEWIRVSNTDHDWNLKAIAKLRESAKTLGLALNYTGDDAAVHRALEVGHQCGVDYVQVRQALELRGHVTTRKPPTIDDLLLFVTEYKFDDSANPHGYTNCYGYHFVPFVWHDGDVDVCGYHHKKGKPYTLGNLHHESFTEIMQKAPRAVPVCASCQVCCKNHEANKLTNEALAMQNPEFV